MSQVTRSIQSMHTAAPVIPHSVAPLTNGLCVALTGLDQRAVAQRICATDSPCIRSGRLSAAQRGKLDSQRLLAALSSDDSVRDNTGAAQNADSCDTRCTGSVNSGAGNTPAQPASGLDMYHALP